MGGDVPISSLLDGTRSRGAGDEQSVMVIGLPIHVEE
jgi:hypothetical protein